MYLVGIHLFGPVAQVFDCVFLVTMERDWVLVMGQAASNIAADERKQQNNNSSILVVEALLHQLIPI